MNQNCPAGMPLSSQLEIHRVQPETAFIRRRETKTMCQLFYTVLTELCTVLPLEATPFPRQSTGRHRIELAACFCPVIYSTGQASDPARSHYRVYTEPSPHAAQSAIIPPVIQPNCRPTSRSKFFSVNFSPAQTKRASLNSTNSINRFIH